ncbi:hypothetical protein Dda_9479 [Drechslerella dactyloides]|uniref:Uncharacterized protein n=1 Tax=Drechslerella dactyloides TaxID=74499 RepID=A0AAD6IP89_DREDA|nr:hypothetical protein Dda_9479 [Drechslerella dactyloides]
MTSYPVLEVIVAPALIRELANATVSGFEPCGQGKYCVNNPIPGLRSCGTWFGMSNYCCLAVVSTGSGDEDTGVQPCGAVPEIQGKTIDEIGEPSFNATTTCPSGSVDLTTFEDGMKSCCPGNPRSLLSFFRPNQDFGDAYFVNLYCGDYTITSLVPEGLPPTETPGQPSPTSEATSAPEATSIGARSSSTSTRSSRGVSSSAPTSEQPPPSTSTTGQSQPNSGSGWRGPGSSRIASLVMGSAIFALFVGAQL